MEATDPAAVALPNPRHEMTGLTLSMAPAVEANVPFHRSHSTPDLLSRLTDSATPPNTAAASSSSPSSLSRDHPSHRTSSLKSLPLPPSLPSFEVPSFDFDHHDFHATFSLEEKLNIPNLQPAPPAPSELEDVGVRNIAEAPVDPEVDTLRRSRSMIDKPRLWLPSSRSSPDFRKLEKPDGPAPSAKDNGSLGRDRSSRVESKLEPKPLERSRTVESFAGFARRSWMSPSRSPSPSSKKKTDSKDSPDRGGPLGRKSKTKPARSASPEAAARKNSSPRPRAEADGFDRETNRSADSLSSTSRALNRASVYFTKIKQKPQNVFVRSASSSSLSTSSSLVSSKPAESDPDAPFEEGAASANTAGSVADTLTLQTRNRPLFPRDSSHTASTCTSDTGTSSEDASQATADTALTMPHNPTSRDPLWATFRNLDADFARFTGKNSNTARMAAVRGVLVPFLRSTAYHPSNADKRLLTPEDVDRRATILSKWWNGLLEMLDTSQSRAEFGMPRATPMAGAPSQPVAGIDRPALLEAATMIMTRPEWRLSTSYFQPLADRSPFERVRARPSSDSSDDSSDHGSSDSAFIAESAEHNVRTMFVTNLLAQMAIVVDKMSMRHAPLSVVNWSGKVCAYAFFFVPGVADVLVRLWGLRADLVRRVADEFGLPRRSKGESDDIVALFPPNLGGLGWTSVKAMTDKLRLATKLPLLTAKIPWHGPWVSRWRGGDTDLLFIFCKYYYILAEEFMPPELPLVEKARAPAFVLLHAQLLATLDSTIHRQAAMDAMLGPPLAEDPYGADASITALPLPSNNLLRGMDENRLIILLKDILSDNAIGVVHSVKLAFAEAFMALLKGAAKRTSRYEHASCFMLCDFLEEAIMTYDAFQNSLNNSYATSPREESAPLPLSSEFAGPSAQTVDFIDWPFWFEVGKMILNSNNTMAEIRMLSFVFAVWDGIAADPARKEAVCVDWLLSEEVFTKFFNNWCPMVRAYYMRLLCWRMCRDSGRADELDTKIFLLVSQRLKTVWSHYLWLKQSADVAGRLPPSTAPCYPTPGKRFMIIRTELQTPQPGFLVGFDQMSVSSSFANLPTGGADYRTIATTGEGEKGSSPSPDGNSTSYKKKWSLLGKVLSLTAGTAAGINGPARRTWDDELEDARRETATSRMVRAGAQLLSGPPPPPKQGPSSTVTASSDSTSSTGSAPVYEAAQYVFRFTLAWQSAAAAAAGPPRDRILTRPRLPAPAQSRVSARSAALNGKPGGNPAMSGSAMFRSESPPPIAAGLPPPTRRISGLALTGLVSEARNAKPLENEPLNIKNRRRSMTPAIGGGGAANNPLIATPTSRHQRRSSADDQWNPKSSVSSAREPTTLGNPPSLDLNLSLDLGTPDEDPRGASDNESTESYSSELELERERELERQRNMVRPTKPTGANATAATYAGRALAEWSLVVNECNSFVDRRRDEGVLGLSEVEVPTLGVEGLGVRRAA